MKICTKCHEYHEDEMFYKGYSICKKCHKEKSIKWALENKDKNNLYRAEWERNWRKNNPTANRLRDRKKELKRLGITIEIFDKILKEQEGKCAICKVNFEKENKKSCIDHSHETGEIRGILCKVCNLQLGHIEIQRIKNFTFFNEAIQYLKLRSTKSLSQDKELDK